MSGILNAAIISFVFATSAAAEVSPPPGACHAGAYAMSDGSRLVITLSDVPALRYRTLDGSSGRLYPVSAHRYVSGDGWAVREPVTVRVDFGGCIDGQIRFQRNRGSELNGKKIQLPTAPLRFASDGIELFGQLVLPRDETPAAVVVLQYGGGRESAVRYNYLQHLLPLYNIAVFVFDKRGTGRSAGAFSAHIGMLAGDLVAAIEAVRSHMDLAEVPLGLMGESQGGWVVPLAATRTPVDFVVVSYGLAVSMLEEDRLEMIQSLRRRGYGPGVIAKGERLHRAAAQVMVSRFSSGMEDLRRLKKAWRDEAWFAHIGGDFTSVLATSSPENMPEVRTMFDFPYDLGYDPLPTIRQIEVPQLWMLAGEDTEAPHESTLAILRELKAAGQPIDLKVFPGAEHGMIQVEESGGHRLAGQYAEGYFDLLIDWILDRKVTGERRSSGR